MRLFPHLIVIIFVFFLCCSHQNLLKNESTRGSQIDIVKHSQHQYLSSSLQQLVDSMIDNQSEDPIHNVVLLVQKPGYFWKGAAGKADGLNEDMTADHKFKIASIGKTFTATLILQLMEEDFLKLEDTIDKYLDNQTIRLDDLHLFNGKSYGRQITIEQLLSHTSGIADYMEDPRFIPGVIENPKKQYTPKKILDIYYEYETNKKALFPPGQDYNYSDVNYVLLAMIVEQVTGSSYQSQLKLKIFDRLDMENSYLEYYEQPRGEKPLSHAFFSTFDLIDAVNTSFDWGGGGIISTCSELNTFFRGLLKGQLFKKRSTLNRMLKAADKGLGGMDYDYGLGIMKRLLHGITFYGHGGAYDCDIFYAPKRDISVCMSLNQMNTHGKRDQFLLEALKIIL